jgi:hypothetical protein
LGVPPNEPAKDWAVLVRRASASDVSTKALVETTKFLVKLGVDIGAQTSSVGDPVTAVVISPERFLGARFSGVVDQAPGDRGGARFTFSELAYRGDRYRVTSRLLGFVNSKGHPSVDEQERPLRVADGVLVSDSADWRVDEGSEFQLQVDPVGN